MGCDIHCYAETRDKNGKWKADLADTFSNGQDDGYDDSDLNSSYDDRNYSLFGLLAGVRRNCEWAFQPKGAPPDASEEVAAVIARWNGDAHTQSWLTLRELRKKQMELLLAPDQYAQQLNQYLLEMLLQINWPEGANGDNHRIVFFFDN